MVFLWDKLLKKKWKNIKKLRRNITIYKSFSSKENCTMNNTKKKVKNQKKIQLKINQPNQNM